MNFKTVFARSFLLLLILSQTPVYSQSETPADPLFKTVQSLDAKLFDAYNKCDLETIGSMVSDDLEFYHDQGGLMVGREPFLAAIKKNICGKVARRLIASTLEVYPLNRYGAVELGVHRFNHPSNPEEGESDAKFILLWQNKNGTWVLTRAISYEHDHGLLAK